MSWVYHVLKALLDWLRETPPPEIHEGNAPDDLKDDLNRRIADLPRLPDQDRAGS